MKLTERLNVLIQAATLSQKNGILTLDEAVKAKSAIDVISDGTLNQNFTTAINTLIKLAVSSQKKGVYSLKDAHMIYLAVDGIENEFQNELNRISGGIIRKETQNQHVKNNDEIEKDRDNGQTIVSVAPKKLKKNS